MDEQITYGFALIGLAVTAVAGGAIISILVQSIYEALPPVRRKREREEAERQYKYRKPIMDQWEKDGYRDAERDIRMERVVPGLGKRFQPTVDWIGEAYNKGYDRYLDEHKEEK